MTEKKNVSLRRMRFAGTWYEANPLLLEKQLDAFLKQASSLTSEKIKSDASVAAIVAPHAGYFYSGEVAAAAYHAPCAQKIKRVILLGPSHYEAFHGIGLSMMEAFETPLGNILLDQAMLQSLRVHPLFFDHEEAHRLEHSLEMQLPFLKKKFSDALLVPLLVGHLEGEQEILESASFLKSWMQEGDLIVVSSDFTHYGPRFQYTPFDALSPEKIQELDMMAYHFLEKRDVAGFLKFQKETKSTICGFYPLALLLALLPEKITASLLAYDTSQKRTQADLQHSVSYLAIAFVKEASRDATLL